MLFLELMQAGAYTLEVLCQRPHGVAFDGQDLQHTGLSEDIGSAHSDYVSGTVFIQQPKN